MQLHLLKNLNIEADVIKRFCHSFGPDISLEEIAKMDYPFLLVSNIKSISLGHIYGAMMAKGIDPVWAENEGFHKRKSEYRMNSYIEKAFKQNSKDTDHKNNIEGPIKKCPKCGGNEYYMLTKVSGIIKSYFNMDGSDSAKVELQEDLKRNKQKTKFCSTCDHPIGFAE